MKSNLIWFTLLNIERQIILKNLYLIRSAGMAVMDRDLLTDLFFIPPVFKIMVLKINYLKITSSSVWYDK